MPRFAIALVVAGGLVAVSSASAASRYAAPNGIATGACPQTSPCTLERAVEGPGIAAGDEVVVTAGTYAIGSGLDVDAAIEVGGEPGAAPVINSTASGTAIRVDDPGAVVHDLEVNSTADALVVSAGIGERIVARSSGTLGCIVGSTDADLALLRDTVCRSTKPTGTAWGVSLFVLGDVNYVSRLRNVTAYAGGTGGYGIRVEAANGADIDVDGRSVIASGGLADVFLGADGTSSVDVALATSNYSTSSAQGPGPKTITGPNVAGNQSAEPLFTSPATGDLSQLPGSPTIDAGSLDLASGTRDATGAPRVDGPAPDIGAYEADRTAPETSIVSGPAGRTKEGRPTFGFSASETGVTYECQIDGGGFQSCATPFTVGDSLSQGGHSIRVRAIDRSGNTDASPAERSFVVDRTVQGANVSAKRSQRQRGRNLSLKVSVKAAEDVVVSAKGKVRVKKKSFDVVAKKATLEGGSKRTLKLKTKKPAAARKILKLLRRGEKAQASVEATFTDDLGNRAVSGTVPVKLKK